LSISPQAVPPLALPPDREIPFQLSAPAAQAGMHEIRVSAVDPSSGLRSEARAQVNVVPASFSARPTPASVTLRAGGAAVSIGVSTDAVQCLGDQPVSVALGALPPGISASPPSGVMQRPGDPALIRLQALPDASPGRHTVAVNLVHSGRF